MMNREEVEAFLIGAQDLSGRALREGMQAVFESAPRHLDILRNNLR
ncbi:MAG: hypothetical protein ABIR57_04820 [Aeromicrobium sp.]